MRSNYIFVIFLLFSILAHLLVVNEFDLTPEVTKKSDPISVSVIPKKKKEPASEQNKEQPKPNKTIENSPLDEELDTKLDQMDAVPAGGENQEEKSVKSENKGEQPRKAEKETEIEALAEDKSDTEVPKVAPEERFSKEQIDGVLNPDDIIKKYAEEGGDVTGEDSVSLQYVKIKYQSYFYKFARRLYHVWLYPRDAAMRGEKGTVRINFVISRAGMISGIKVIKSSGYPDLDREAVLALKKTAGVPLPKSYELNFLKVDAYFEYVLGGGFNIY